MQDAYRGSDVDQSTLQLLIDQLEELVATLIEEVRARPAVAVAIAAGVLGAVGGSVVAARIATRKAGAPTRVVRRVRRFGDMADLAGLAMRLLENPIVRAAVLNQVRRRIGL